MPAIHVFYLILSLSLFFFVLYYVYTHFVKKQYAHPELLNTPFPEKYREILEKYVPYYQKLPDDKKKFEKRVLQFLAEKKITGIDTEVTDKDKVLVAASAVIPAFAFDDFNYPNVDEILLYPNSFDQSFQTHNEVESRNILGMVGEGFLNGKVILSKPDLEKSFDGSRHKTNVGIHEFVHLIDKADGATDGVPELLFEHSYAFPWLREMKREMEKIEKGKSDISPYALTNPAEFLAVASEYFFSNPEKMKKRHPELYAYLSKIFKQNPV
ncbi:MAG TPA: peptidase [Flavobacteriales bacterium]|nr:peptidase [Flavobacteriales bacterium]|tara:strand:+ start:12432 stop:13238 length:807 start_codon:yes stop_codon:yes gene_type:complete